MDPSQIFVERGEKSWAFSSHPIVFKRLKKAKPGRIARFVTVSIGSKDGSVLVRFGLGQTGQFGLVPKIMGLTALIGLSAFYMFRVYLHSFDRTKGSI